MNFSFVFLFPSFFLQVFAGNMEASASSNPEAATEPNESTASALDPAPVDSKTKPKKQKQSLIGM